MIRIRPYETLLQAGIPKDSVVAQHGAEAEIVLAVLDGVAFSNRAIMSRAVLRIARDGQPPIAQAWIQVGHVHHQRIRTLQNVVVEGQEDIQQELAVLQRCDARQDCAQVTEAAGIGVQIPIDARDGERGVVRACPEGSIERRRALAEIIRLGIELGGAGMEESLAAFASEFPDAPQLDELATTLAVQLDDRGDPEGARSLLAGVGGPRSALERGYLYLAAGEVVQGREALQGALSGVSPDVATEVIALLDLLDRLEGEALAAFLQSAVLAHRGRTEGALSELEVAIDAVPRDGRPSLLAMGARIADVGGVPEQAADFRERIIRDHPYASEVPEATLGLARFKGARPGGLDEAIRLLEDLILDQPNSAVVPIARRELQRIQRGSDR